MKNIVASALLVITACDIPQAPAQAWGHLWGQGVECGVVPVGPHRALTARHCAERLEDGAMLATFYEQGGRWVMMAAYDEKSDAALLVLDGEPLDVMETVTDELPIHGEWSFFFSPRTYSHSCFVYGYSWETKTAEALCYPDAQPGDSGSPVVMPNGKVWAVVSAKRGGYTLLAGVRDVAKWGE